MKNIHTPIAYLILSIFLLQSCVQKFPQTVRIYLDTQYASGNFPLNSSFFRRYNQYEEMKQEFYQRYTDRLAKSNAEIVQDPSIADYTVTLMVLSATTYSSSVYANNECDNSSWSSNYYELETKSLSATIEIYKGQNLWVGNLNESKLLQDELDEKYSEDSNGFSCIEYDLDRAGGTAKSIMKEVTRRLAKQTRKLIFDIEGF